MNYTWGYIKENALAKLNLGEAEANEQNFLSNFPYWANEAMTQICSAIKPAEKFLQKTVTEENLHELVTFPDDFIAFSNDVVEYRPCAKTFHGHVMPFEEVGDEYLNYVGYNQVAFLRPGEYIIPYKARWFFFTKDLADDVVITAPADVCDAIPSYLASQCYKIDDEQRAAIYRNEFEIFLARIDDTSFERQRTMHVGGGW